MEDRDLRNELYSLINDLCISGSKNLDEQKLKCIKNICKTSDEYIKQSYEMLLVQLKKEHSEVRYSALLIVDCLFERSGKFRELLLEEFQPFFELVLETNPDEPLPPPTKTANQLKKLAAQTVKKWHDKFGDDYKLLSLGFNYLKNYKKVDFVSFSHQTNAQRIQTQKDQERQQIFINRKFTEYVAEMNEIEMDIKNNVKQLEQCIDILVPREDLFDDDDFEVTNKKNAAAEENQMCEGETDSKLENSDVDQETDVDDDDDDDEDEFEEVPSKKSKEELEEDRQMELKYFGLLNGNKLNQPRMIDIQINHKLKENEENKVIVETIKGLAKELQKSYLPKINNWLKNFTQVKTAGDKLKKAIDLKNSVKAVLKRYEDLRIVSDTEENQRANREKNPKLVIDDMPGTSDSKNMPPRVLTEKEKKRLEMLKIAPVINLEEMQYMTGFVNKIEIENPYFTRQETELPEQLLNAPRMMKKTYIGKSEEIKWSCRAPLKSGKLCPRMDRYKCPIHGKIVARNEVGEIVNENDRLEYEKNNKEKEVPAWKDAELIADINAATGNKLEVVGDKTKKKKRKNNTNLTDKSKEENTTRKRLEKKLLDPKNLNRVGSSLDSIERRLNHEKFHHNFNYALQY